MARVTPLLTSLISLITTYPSPQETLYDTPETLPTTEPATPQVRYTIGASNLPTLNISVASKKYSAIIYVGGKFTTAGTLYIRMKKNNSSLWTGSASVAANTFYTVNAYFYNISQGDLLEVALWSSVSDSNWDYKAIQCFITDVLLYSKSWKNCFKNVQYPAGTKKPVLTLGTPGEVGAALYHVFHLDIGIDTIETSGKTYDLIKSGLSYGIFRIRYGGSVGLNNAETKTHATYRPYYQNNYVPLEIKMRGLRLD